MGMSIDEPLFATVIGWGVDPTMKHFAETNKNVFFAMNVLQQYTKV